MSQTTVSVIVAMTPRRVIGRGNQMPWHVPEDLQHFKNLTLGHPIIMGRKTFDSIGRPLPGRNNLVISRNRNWKAEGVTAVSSMEEALALCEGEVFVIGGAQIYAMALPIAERLYVTLVHSDTEGDTFFPAPDPAQWQLVERSARQRSKSGCEFSFQRYRRCS